MDTSLHILEFIVNINSKILFSVICMCLQYNLALQKKKYDFFCNVRYLLICLFVPHEITLFLICRTTVPNFLFETIIIVLHCKTCTLWLNCKTGALQACYCTLLYMVIVEFYLHNYRFVVTVINGQE